MAAGATAALFQAARASVNPACCTDGDAGGAGDTACPGEVPALVDGEPMGVVALVPAAVAVIGVEPVVAEA